MNRKEAIREYLKHHVIVSDGAMGTYYARLKQDDGAVSENANLSESAIIKKIHKEYIAAGAKMIRTNTFAANRFSLNITREERKKMVDTACRIAKEAAGEAEDAVYLAGSIGPIPEFYINSEEEVLEEYKEMVDGLLANNLDLILFETFSDLYYVKDLVRYIREKSDIYIMVDFCLNKNGYSKSGVSANRLIEESTTIAEIDCIGFNCGIGSGHMKSLLQKTRLPKEKSFAVMPNAGYPEQLHYRMVFRDNAEYFKENMAEIKKFGVNIIGGCCGTTPEYIKAIVDTVDTQKIEERQRGKKDVEAADLSEEVTPNRFYELFNQQKKVIAVELDPPYDAKYEKLIEQAHTLKSNGVDIITMADSPMGRSRVDSILMSIKIMQEVDMPVMPHVCCRDKNMIAMRSSLLGAYINEIRNLLVVTGDPVPSDSRTTVSSVFDYNSIRLMGFVNEMNEEHFKEDPIYYGGALNYARGNIDKVIERMNKKIEAGCKYFLTQPAYSDEDIERLRYIRSKVDTKLLCGIMPFVSWRNANFVKNEFSGIYVPDEVVQRYHPDMSKEEAEDIGAQLATELVAKMADFADGYYIMLPFNRVSLIEKIKFER